MTSSAPPHPPRIEPVATYRIQLGANFTFAEVVGVLDQLTQLGVSHVYLSPILTAAPGSPHGYDWLPPARIAPLLGGRDGFELLRAHARAVGLGLIVDIVPNHVGIGAALENPWWTDVLRHGLGSPYAAYFELYPRTIDGADDVIALPYLGSPSDLDQLRLDDEGNLCLFERVLPTAPGTVGAGDTPQEVHLRQHYRLVPARGSRSGYRRFLGHNHLAALDQTNPAVYEATHAWLRELAAADMIDGVRIDHLDGLIDPIGYVRRLRADLGDRLIIVEKTLMNGEDLDPALAADGTVGYDQLRTIEAVFTAAPGIIELDETYHRILGLPGAGDDLREQSRRLREVFLLDEFPSRLQQVTDQLAAPEPGIPTHRLMQAVTVLVCSLDVYRPDYPVVQARLGVLFGELRAARPELHDALDYVESLLRERDLPVAGTLGELASTLMAAAFEGCGFYRTARLVSTQDIGTSPRFPTITSNGFHEFNRNRAAAWPRTLNTLGTHDSLRSADVRARIAVLAQVPQRWTQLVLGLWARTSAPHDRTCYFLLQNMVGVWPYDPEAPGRVPDAALRNRFHVDARKAMRNAGLISDWHRPDEDAEEAVLDWLDVVCTGPEAQRIADLVAIIAPAGLQEALARTAVCLLVPGIGDIYQGNQWWAFTLTDPDNRRPVDYGQPVTHPKFALIRQCLDTRRRHPAAFAPGSSYTQLYPRGLRANHLVTFARGSADGAPEVVVAAVRMSRTFGGPQTRAEANLPLPEGYWTDAGTGQEHTGTVRADILLGTRPVAILERSG